MIKISYKSEMQNYNPLEKTCMVMLFGLVFKDGEEIGKVLLDKQLLSGEEYDLYVNQANESVNEEFIKKWESETLQPLVEIIKSLEIDSNRGNSINLIKSV